MQYLRIFNINYIKQIIVDNYLSQMTINERLN